MSGETPRKKTGRGYARNLDAGSFGPMVDSFDLHLRAERKSARTIRTYTEAASWFAGEYLIPAGLAEWVPGAVTLTGGPNPSQLYAVAQAQIARHHHPPE